MSTILSDEVFFTFAGLIDQQATQRVFNNFAVAVNGKAKRIHLLIQSAGGMVGDGIAIYNYLRNLPVELITYNSGSVLSIGVIMYLSGKIRKATRNATFLIHKTTCTPQAPVTADAIKHRTRSIELDDKNIDSILHDHIEMPGSNWDLRDKFDLTISAEEAIAFKLVHEIADFAPPPGFQIYNI